MSWRITPSFTQWTPALISTALWLDAADNSTVFSDAGSTQAVAGTSTVQQWSDKSGNSRHVSQATSNLRPSYTSAGLNGKNILTFSSKTMRTALNALSFPTLAVFTVASNSRDTSVLLGIPEAELSHDSPFFRFVVFRNASPVGSLNVRLNGTPATGVLDSFGSGANIYSLDSSNAQARLNSTVAVTGTPATLTYPNSVPFVLGSNAASNELMNGTFAEVVAVSSAPSTDTRQKLEGYLAHKWGLTANLPETHPYKHQIPTPGA
jgi:hypothetical protein